MQWRAGSSINLGSVSCAEPCMHVWHIATHGACAACCGVGVAQHEQQQHRHAVPHAGWQAVQARRHARVSAPCRGAGVGRRPGWWRAASTPPPAASTLRRWWSLHGKRPRSSAGFPSSRPPASACSSGNDEPKAPSCHVRSVQLRQAPPTPPVSRTTACRGRSQVHDEADRPSKAGQPLGRPPAPAPTCWHQSPAAPVAGLLLPGPLGFGIGLCGSVIRRHTAAAGEGSAPRVGNWSSPVMCKGMHMPPRASAFRPGQVAL